MNVRSATSVWKTRSGRGMTNAGRPDSQMAAYQSPRIDASGVTTRRLPRASRPIIAPPGVAARPKSRPRMWAAVSTNRESRRNSVVRGPRGGHRDDLEHAPGRRGEHQHPVGQHHRLVDVMGHEQHGLRAGLERAAEPLAQLLALHLVERRERLVHQEHRGVVGDGAGDVDPLDHPARELVRALVLVAGQAELAQEVAGREADPPGDALGEAHVVHRPLPGKDRRPLGDEPEEALPAGRPPASRRRPGRPRCSAAPGRPRSAAASSSRTPRGRRARRTPPPPPRGPRPRARASRRSAATPPGSRSGSGLAIYTIRDSLSLGRSATTCRGMLRMQGLTPHFLPGRKSLVIISAVGRTRGIWSYSL